MNPSTSFGAGAHAAASLTAALALCASAACSLARAASFEVAATGPWLEQKVTAADGTANTNFGTSAALHHGLAAIGGYGDDSYRGAVYLFRQIDGAWTQTGKLTADDAHGGDEFGYRTSLADDMLVVGAFTATIGDNTAQGAAYVFEPAGTDWTQTQKLLADDGGVFDDFGASVSRDGDTLLIGANGAFIGENGAQGAAYAFAHANGTWTQTQKLTADDGMTNDNFGMDVAVVGDSALVSAHVAAVDGVAGAGAVYAFTRSGGTWTQTQKLVSDSAATFGQFGIKLARVGDTVLIAATGENGGRGVVHVFTRTDGTWTQSTTLSADDAAAGDNFGSALAFDGAQALIGADIATVDADTSRGKAYLFVLGTDGWHQDHTFIASDGATDNFYGSSVALEGGTAIVDSANAMIDGNLGQGAAYFYGDDRVFGDGFDAATP